MEQPPLIKISSNALFHLINVQPDMTLHLDVFLPGRMYLLLNIFLEILHLQSGLVSSELFQRNREYGIPFSQSAQS